MYACVCVPMCIYVHMLEVQAFPGGPACYMDTVKGTPVLMIVQQIFLISGPSLQPMYVCMYVCMFMVLFNEYSEIFASNFLGIGI